MNAALTKAWAAERGCRTESPAMLRAYEDMRLAGIREVRQMHAARLERCRSLHNPAMLSAAIYPAASIKEALEDAQEVIRAYGRMSTWRKANRRQQFVEAQKMVGLCRYFRRYATRIWAREAA